MSRNVYLNTVIVTKIFWIDIKGSFREVWSLFSVSFSTFKNIYSQNWAKFKRVSNSDLQNHRHAPWKGCCQHQDHPAPWWGRWVCVCAGGGGDHSQAAVTSALRHRTGLRPRINKRFLRSRPAAAAASRSSCPLLSTPVFCPGQKVRCVTIMGNVQVRNSHFL